MKYLLFIFLVTLFSCGYSKPQPKSSLPTPIVTECSTVKNDFVGGNLIQSWRYKMDGHLYIATSIGECSGITHDPDCPCKK